MDFYMLSLPITSVGSELLDLKLISVRPQHNNRSIGHQFLNDGLGAGVRCSFEIQATNKLFPFFSPPRFLSWKG